MKFNKDIKIEIQFKLKSLYRYSVATSTTVAVLFFMKYPIPNYNKGK